jgi:hypothetical protein
MKTDYYEIDKISLCLSWNAAEAWRSFEYTRINWQ